MDRLQAPLEPPRCVARDRKTECASRAGDAMDHPQDILELRDRHVAVEQAPPQILDLRNLSGQLAGVVVPQHRKLLL